MLAGAISLVPPGTVELILAMIDAGELPEPTANTMAEWLDICHAAKAGEFTITHEDFTIPIGRGHQDKAPAPPPRPPDPRPGPIDLAAEMRAMGWM